MAGKKEEPRKLPEINSGYDKPHLVLKGDPAIDGPYLDDIRAEQAEYYRSHRAATEEAKAAAREEEEAAVKEEEKDAEVKKVAKK